MPTVHKLTPEEVQQLQNKGTSQRSLIKRQYDVFLSEYNIGDYGEARLDADENRLTVRNRLRAAAQRRGLNIIFMRTSGDLIRFHMNGPYLSIQTPSAATSTTTAPGKHKGGRPRKSA